MMENQLVQKTILIVEDSQTQALHVQALLEDAGIRTLWAGNGRIGVEMTHTLCPDLIILDLEMPEMNGLQVCAELQTRPETATIPIIMLTAHDEPETLAESLALGAVDFIPKDNFSDEVLLATLREMQILENV